MTEDFTFVPGKDLPVKVVSEHSLFTNDQRTILLTIWKNGPTTIATRETSAHTWGPPVYLHETR